MMHVMYSTAFTATDMASKILNFLKEIYWKYEVMAKLLNQAISKGYEPSSTCTSITAYKKAVVDN